MEKKKVTLSQIDRLVAILEKNEELANGAFGEKYGKIQMAEEWNSVALQLNAVEGGPRKTGYKWQQTWRDLKKNITKRYIRCKEEQQRTGGCRLVSQPLTSLELRAMKIIGKEKPKVSQYAKNAPSLARDLDKDPLGDTTTQISGRIRSRGRAAKNSHAIEKKKFTFEQFDRLVSFMEENEELAIGSFTRKYGRLKTVAEWKTLAVKLNAIHGGPQKNGKKWQQTWRDLKKNIKRKYMNCKEEEQRTGGRGVLRQTLSPLEIRALKILRKKDVDITDDAKSESFRAPSCNQFEDDDDEVPIIELEVKPFEDSASDSIQTSTHFQSRVQPLHNVEFTYRGLMPPVFTPFNHDFTLNVNVIPQYAKYLSNKGIKGILVNGTSGEGMSMSVAERKIVTEVWLREAQSLGMHVMVQVGGAPLPDVLQLATHAEMSGANSILVLPELFFKPTNVDELVEYLKVIAEAAPETSLFYYHNPAFTCVNINMASLVTAASKAIKTFRGLKFTSVNLSEGAMVLKACGEKNSVFLGADQLLSAAAGLGFTSSIGTSFNMLPELGNAILEGMDPNGKENNLKEAIEKQNILTEIIEIITKYGSWVSTMKVAMELLTGINVGPPRSPLLKVLTSQQRDEMAIELNKKGLGVHKKNN